MKQHKRIVTEWRNGFNNIRGLLRSDTNGQRTSQISYGMVQMVKQHQKFVREW